MNTTDKEAFKRICASVLEQKRAEGGIGTLAEKSIHAVLKNYYCRETEYHEIKTEGFVADICRADGSIIEIQTRQFFTLRRKLAAYLPNHEVTIVYPIANKKWLRWIDVDSGEVSAPRKSPKLGTPYALFGELYGIKEYLLNPHLHLCVTALDIEEYRLLNGWSHDKKRGSSRNDGIPVDIVYELRIDCIQDYLQLLPITLPEEFTTSDYRKSAHISKGGAGISLNILYHVGVVERIGKKGNSYLYKVAEKYL